MDEFANQASESADQQQPAPQWQPLSPSQRRVLGVLVEKAKTTPDGYPMSLNALTNGCNQKSNRSPQMNLSTEQIDDVLEELREMGAVAEVQGSGRVPKYRHYAYEWLGVDKYEIAVITELLLRGEQTIGELRGRAARMEQIGDLATLRPILQSLVEKKLVISLTPEGRGQIVTHGLYKDREMDDVRARAASGAAASPPTAATSAQAAPANDGTTQIVEELRSDIEDLRRDLDELRDQVREILQMLG